MYELENFLGEQNGLGTVYHHGEAEEFKQHMEDASNIPGRSDIKMTNIKTSIIGISVALVVVACLFTVGICLAGRIIVRSCLKHTSSNNQSSLSDTSSFTYEAERA